MSAFNPKLRTTLEQYLDTETEETVATTIRFLRRLGASERIFAGEWLVQIQEERRVAETTGA